MLRTVTLPVLVTLQRPADGLERRISVAEQTCCCSKNAYLHACAVDGCAPTLCTGCTTV